MNLGEGWGGVHSKCSPCFNCLRKMYLLLVFETDIALTYWNLSSEWSHLTSFFKLSSDGPRPQWRCWDHLQCAPPLTPSAWLPQALALPDPSLFPFIWAWCSLTASAREFLTSRYPPPNSFLLYVTEVQLCCDLLPVFLTSPSQKLILQFVSSGTFPLLICKTQSTQILPLFPGMLSLSSQNQPNTA